MDKLKVGDVVVAVAASRGWGEVTKGDRGIVTAVNEHNLPYEYEVKFDLQSEWMATGFDLQLVMDKFKLTPQASEKSEKMTDLLTIATKTDDEQTLITAGVYDLNGNLTPSGEHLVANLYAKDKEVRVQLLELAKKKNELDKGAGCEC